MSNMRVSARSPGDGGGGVREGRRLFILLRRGQAGLRMFGGRNPSDKITNRVALEIVRYRSVLLFCIHLAPQQRRQSLSYFRRKKKKTENPRGATPQHRVHDKN